MLHTFFFFFKHHFTNLLKARLLASSLCNASPKTQSWCQFRKGKCFNFTAIPFWECPSTKLFEFPAGLARIRLPTHTQENSSVKELFGCS